MNRRTFLLGGSAAALAAVAGAATHRALRAPVDLAALQAELAALGSRPLATTAGWSPAQVFVHLAQSIEYSLTGYPALKSPLFRHTAGAAAFQAFATAGVMRHPLTEPIPGAPALATDSEARAGSQADPEAAAQAAQAALARLLAALQAFSAHAGPLAPHFAYGALDKDEYTLAHAMHVRDHLRLFKGIA